MYKEVASGPDSQQDEEERTQTDVKEMTLERVIVKSFCIVHFIN